MRAVLGPVGVGTRIIMMSIYAMPSNLVKIHYYLWENNLTLVPQD